MFSFLSQLLNGLASQSKLILTMCSPTLRTLGVIYSRTLTCLQAVQTRLLDAVDHLLVREYKDFDISFGNSAQFHLTLLCHFCRSAELELTEPRMLTGEEQKALCKLATETTSAQLGINAEDARCFIEDQVITPITGGRRLENGDQLYMVTGVAKLNFDAKIPPAVANPKKMTEVMKVAKTKAADKAVKGAIKRTEAPSASPSMAPSISAAPTTETAAPTRAPVASSGFTFSSADIGYCKYTGSSYETSDGLYNLKSSGADIWSTEDGFHYMFIETSGDVDLSVRVENFSRDKHAWAKGGVSLDLSRIDEIFMNSNTYLDSLFQSGHDTFLTG